MKYLLCFIAAIVLIVGMCFIFGDLVVNGDTAIGEIIPVYGITLDTTQYYEISIYKESANTNEYAFSENFPNPFNLNTTDIEETLYFYRNNEPLEFATSDRWHMIYIDKDIKWHNSITSAKAITIVMRA